MLFRVENCISFSNFSKAVYGQNERLIKQADPCQSKSGVVADVQYCDRYWECGPDDSKELYDCPNGLVWVGKNRGIADGCDYPWRNPSLCNNKDLASKLHFNYLWC